MRRPALAAAVWFAAGILAGHQWRLPPVALLAGAGALFLSGLAGYARGWPGRRMGCLLGAAVCALGAARYETVTEALPGNHLVGLIGTQLELEGVIAGEPEVGENGLRALLRVEAASVGDSTFAVRGEALVRFYRMQPDLGYGDRVRLAVRLRRPGTARNPGAFDYRAYLERKGVYATALVRRPEEILAVRPGEGGRFWKEGVLAVRRAVRKGVDRNLSGGPAGVLKGVLLGEKRGVPEGVREAFARAGVNHVLAVSGLHVGLIAAVIFFGCRALGLGRRAAGLGTVGALWFYALVTGLPPSAVRASAMGSAAILGALGDREGEGLNTLGAAGLGMLIFRPRDLFDAGFQLSFAATGAILLLYRPIRSWFPAGEGRAVGKWVCAPLAVSLAAQAGTAPLVAAYFGQVSVVGLLANLVVVPLVGVAVALGLLAVLSSVLCGPAATLFNGANWAVLKAAIGAAELLARPAWACVAAPAPGWTATGIYICLLMLFVPEVRKGRAGRYLIFGCLVLANLWVWGPILRRPSGFEVLVLDVGQGDGIFLRFPNGRTMLVDGGLRARNVDMGERAVAPFLRSRGIRRIDVVVASHPHSDHIGGLVTVLEQFEVGCYLDAGQAYGSWTARRIRELIREKGIVYRTVSAGDSLVGLGGVGALVLHPTPDYVSEAEAPHGLNNGSVVLRLTYEGASVLLTGDIEHETDRDLLRWGGRLRSEVLKAAHHGSRTSSTEAFLRAVQPRLVAVSCGEGNTFGHPSPEVIRRYQGMGIAVFRTDLLGAVRVQIGRPGIRARGWLGGDIFMLPYGGGGVKLPP